jgi:hypothetical protein
MNSAVVAAISVAAQLGAGDALGIIQWDGPHDAAAWRGLLTWVAFAYTVAVLAGALVGHGSARFEAASRPGSGSSARRDPRDQGVASRLMASLVAAGGAAAAIGLAWLPAQGVTPPLNVNPGLVVSLTAGAGVVVGLVLALAGLGARPIGAGIAATAAWLWLLAIASAVSGLTSGEPYTAPRLGVPDAPSLFSGTDWTGPRVMIVMAVLVGITVAGVARWRGTTRLGAALAGFGGPALAATAYLIAGAGERGGPQEEPYVAALIATGAGLISSVLVAMPGRRVPRVATPPTPPADDAPVEGDLIEVSRTPTSPVSSQGRVRPTWAEGSGPYARAYSGTSSQHADVAHHADVGRATVVGSAPVVPRQPVTVTARGTGWDGDTLATPATTDRQSQPGPLGVVYRTPAERPGSVGRHAARE